MKTTFNALSYKMTKSHILAITDWGAEFRREGDKIVGLKSLMLTKVNPMNLAGAIRRIRYLHYNYPSSKRRHWPCVVVEDNDVITQPHPDGCVCRTGPVAVRVEQSESGADAEADAARQALAGSVL